MEDIKGIADTAQKVVDLFYQIPDRPKGKSVQGDHQRGLLRPNRTRRSSSARRTRVKRCGKSRSYLLSCVHSRKVKVNYHDSATSDTGRRFRQRDRRLRPRDRNRRLRTARSLIPGRNIFDYDRWMAAFEACASTRTFTTTRHGDGRRRDVGSSGRGRQPRPSGAEYEKALRAETTQPCNRQCSGCGANKLLGGPCFDYSKDLF